MGGGGEEGEGRGRGNPTALKQASCDSLQMTDGWRTFALLCVDLLLTSLYLLW